MGRPSSPPTHPPPPPRRPPSLSQFVFFFLFFFFLCKLNLKKHHTHTQTHFITHTLLFCLLRPDSGCQRWNDKSNYFFGGGGSGVISMGNTHTHTLPSSSTSQPHHTLPPPSSSSSSPHFIWLPIFFFFIIHSVTRLSVNIAFLSTWQSEHKSPPPPPHLHPPSVNTLTVKTVVLELRTKQEQNSTPRLKGAKAVGLSKKKTTHNGIFFATGLTVWVLLRQRPDESSHEALTRSLEQH